MKKVVVITGASSGIGLATAKWFIKNNYLVYGLSYDDYKTDEMKTYQVDVTNFKKVKEIYQEIFEENGRFDYLINCAGMGISGSVEDTDISDIKYMFEVNYFGMINSCQAAIPFMRKNLYGRIANISSVASFLPIPFQTFYSSNKAAVNLFSEALNIEVKPFGIKVVTFLPGDTKTSFTDNRKKNPSNSVYYGKRIDKSIEVMEKDEQNGMTKEYVGKIIYKNLTKKRPPIRRIIGNIYKLYGFLYRFLPIKLVNQVLGKIYGFEKLK